MSMMHPADPDGEAVGRTEESTWKTAASRSTNKGSQILLFPLLGLDNIIILWGGYL